MKFIESANVYFCRYEGIFLPKPNSETLCALSSFLCELPDIHIGITYISKFRFNIQFQASLLNCFIFTLNTSLPDVPM